MNKEEQSAYYKIYYHKNKEKKLKRGKERYEENKDQILDKNKRYYERNKNRILEYQKEYRQKNKDILNEKSRIRKKNKRHVDPLYKLKCSIRSRTRQAFTKKRWLKGKGTEHLLGTDYKTAFQHIENLFTEGMSWENHGEWHIDHKKPLASAKTEEELKKLCHYTNLQPLWALDNIRKGAKT